MTHPTAARNASIAAAYHAGASAAELAALWGISGSRVWAIAHKLDGPLSPSERSRRLARAGNVPQTRAKYDAAMQQRRAAGLPLGRPRMFPDDPDKREVYMILRDTLGAAYAREAMGL